jgi:DNA-directed RNA polymerase subunit delta
MSNQYTLKISPEQAKEMPMVDLAFIVLKAANEPFYFRDLMTEVAKIKEIKEDDVMEVIAQLYTEINIDGRFACVGTNLWGLKRWYPLEKAEDPVGNTQRPRIINDEDDDDDDDEDLFAEEKDDDDSDTTDKDADDGFNDDSDTDDDEVDEEIDEIDEEIDEDLDDEDTSDDMDQSEEDEEEDDEDLDDK